MVQHPSAPTPLSRSWRAWRRFHLPVGPTALALGAALAALAACGGDELAALGQVEQAITHGSPYDGHPAVGRLLRQTRDGKLEQCTGTLIGARTVLTAAHCVAEAAQLSFELAPVGLATQPALSGAAGVPRRLAVGGVKVHPEYDKEVPASPDLALVWLPQAPGVTPLIIGAQPPLLGQAITLIGFGQTGSATEDGGVKRWTTNVVAALEPTLLGIVGGGDGRGNVCLGDSGGPVLATMGGQEAVVGVNSFLIAAGEESACADNARSVRVDRFVGWIAQAAAGDLALPARGLAGDAQPPDVAIVTPAPGAALGSRTTVRARVQDNIAVREAVLLLDGQLAGRAEQAPYDFSVELQPGPHTLVVVAQDAVGNRAQASVTVTSGLGADEAGAGGCAVAARGPGRGASGGGWLIFLMLLWARRRAARGRAAA